ncbi:MAG: DUF2281 domain-containing protein [Saprospiraceae bacterium]|jgi:hypothetical protein|nr:DUF2281 domain-containing protein [Saprospiraceae bacterium]
MNASEIKLQIFREIDQLSVESLLELREVVSQIIAASAKSPKKKKNKRQFGSMKGLVLYMAPDFNEPLQEFKDYMP